jgi:endonuclease YncB( thermonuclease family)
LRQIHVRIAGVDAPEGAHFGKPAQPHSDEALQWLKDYILNRKVRAYIYKRDQYERVVATVWVRRWLIQRDVGREMLKAGWATVYDAKAGAEFGAFEEEYRDVEAKAKQLKKGIWAGKAKDFESPRAYKTRTADMTTSDKVIPKTPKVPEDTTSMHGSFLQKIVSWRKNK